MNRSRIAAAIAVAMTAGLALAGCSGSAPGSGGSDSVSYMTWEGNDTNAALDATFKKFTKSTKITMNRLDAPNSDYAQKLASLLLAKKAPDFFWCSETQEQNLAAEGLLYDWTDYIKGNKGLTESSFAPGALKLFTDTKGKIYGVPTLANTFGVFYNVDLLKKAGVAVPSQNWTWDDMLADAKKVTGVAGTKGPGLVTAWPLLDSPQGMSAYSVGNGGAPLLDSDLGAKKATASPEMIAGAEKFAAAIKDGSVTGPDYDSSSSLAVFSNGGIPMLFGGQWFPSLFSKDSKVDWGFAPWPAGSTKNVQPIEANGVCSPSTLSNPDATFKAIAYMDSKGFNDVMASVPVAPIAYTPGSTGYFENLTKQGGSYATVATTAKYELAAPDKFVTQLLDPWATKAADVVTASWDPAISGKTDTTTGVEATVKGIQSLIDSQQ